MGTVVVASDYAARGSHSLKVTIPTGGSSAEHYLQLKNLGPLANGHFGRIFFRVQSPTTTPFVHWDLILGAGPYLGQNRRIRWGVTGSGVGYGQRQLVVDLQHRAGRHRDRILGPPGREQLDVRRVAVGRDESAGPVLFR